jgi:hypothetical protein
MKKIFLLLFFISSILFADFNSTKETFKEVSQSFRKKTTKKYHRFLNKIDSYFGESDDINRSSYKEIRKNKLQIVLSVKEKAKLGLHLRGKIVLPQLKNRAELTFSQNDDQELDNQNAISQHDDVVSDSKLHVGLKYYLYREERSRAYAKLSLKIRSPFGPYIKFGVDKSYLSDDFFETDFNNALYYYLNGNKLSASTAVTFYKYINNDYQIAQGNKLYWKGKKDLYLNNSIILYQIFGLYDRVTYKTDFTTSYNSDEKFAHDMFSFSVGYFHRFDKWFFIEAIPRFTKKRDNDYRGEVLFTINFGMLLGR